MVDPLTARRGDDATTGATTSRKNGNKTSADGGELLTSMAPKKINWDLKRDIQPKLDKLERRTQKLIVQLLKERLAKEADDAADDEEGEEQELD